MEIITLSQNETRPPVLLSPEEEDTRSLAPTANRAFAGARVSRLDKDLGEMGEVNRSIYENLMVMRQRSRQLSMDDNYISRFLNLSVQETLGAKGLKLSAQGPDEKVNEVIEELYNDWSTESSTSGDMSLLCIEELAVRTRHCDGEFFCRVVDNFKNNEYGFAIFPFDADRVELGFDAGPAADGSFIQNSIEYDKWLRPIAYHILERHPGDNVARWPDGKHRMRIPAEEIIHYFEPLRPGQGRGIPSTHSALVSAKHLNAYIKATIVASRVISSKFAAITSKDADPHNKPNLGNVDKKKGEIINKVEAGRIFTLNPGESMEVFDPKQPSGEFSPFTSGVTKGMSAGLCVSYAALSGDLSNTSFASGRLGALLDQEYWGLKRTNFINRFKLRMYKKWLLWAYLTQDRLYGVMPAKDLTLYAKKTVVYDKPVVWIDPDKQSKVVERNLKNGMTTLKIELAKQNIDYDSHIEQLLKEKNDLKSFREIMQPGGEHAKKETGDRLNIVKAQQ